jgi:hypothetical protein
MANIEEFDHLVVRKAFEVQESSRMDNLINSIPLPKPATENKSINKQTKPSQIPPVENDDISSDEEEFDRKVHSRKYCPLNSFRRNLGSVVNLIVHQMLKVLSIWKGERFVCPLWRFSTPSDPSCPSTKGHQPFSYSTQTETTEKVNKTKRR